jgi:hypothetical protein
MGALSKYNVAKMLLYFGIYIAMFLVSCIYVGFGAYCSSAVSEANPLHFDTFWTRIVPLIAPFPIREFSSYTGIDLYLSVYLFMFFGGMGMFGGIVGIFNIIKTLFLPRLDRKEKPNFILPQRDRMG